MSGATYVGARLTQPSRRFPPSRERPISATSVIKQSHPVVAMTGASLKSPRKSPARTPKKSPGRSPRSTRIERGLHKPGTPTSALRRLRKTSSSLSAAFEEAELVAVEQEGAQVIGKSSEFRSGGREAPKLVDFKSPPRAVFANASEARDARMKSRTSCLKLSDKDAFVHVERLGCHPTPRFQGYEATDNVVACQPVPIPSPPPSACEPGVRPGLAAPRAASGADHLRPLSRQSSLNSIAWGSTSAGRSAVETPPSAPGAFEASELQGLCRAPLAHNRVTLVSRSCMRTDSRALSSTTAVTAAAPLPRPIAVLAAAPFPRPVAVSAATASPFSMTAVTAAAPLPRPVAVLATASFPRPVAVSAATASPFPRPVAVPAATASRFPRHVAVSAATASPLPHRIAVAAATASPFPRRVPVCGELAPLSPRAGGQGMMSFVPINVNSHSFSVAHSNASSPVASSTE